MASILCHCGRSRIFSLNEASTSATRWYGYSGTVLARWLAARSKKRRLQNHSYSRWRWQLDEVFVRINGEPHYLCRAVDHDGGVLEEFVTKRRDRKAATQFLKKTMKRYCRPENVVADKLRAYFESYRDKNHSIATRIRSVETAAPSEVDHALPKDRLINRCLPVARTKAG